MTLGERQHGEGGEDPGPPRWLLLGGVALACLSALVRIRLLPAGILEHDELNFLRGALRYSVWESRPHFPGYPVFVGVGSVALSLLGESIRSLRVVSALSTSLTALNLGVIAFALGRGGGASARDASLQAVGAALLFNLTAYAWVDGAEAFSDPLALFLGTLALALALTLRSTPLLWGGVGVLLGLMLGARLSYWPLTLAMIPVLSGRAQGWRQILLCVGVASVTVGGWAGWQLWMEGEELLRAGRQHLMGHVSDYGGGMGGEDGALGRLWRLCRVQLAYGLGAHPSLGRAYAAIIGGVWLTLMGLGGHRLIRGGGWRMSLALAWALPYGLWIVIGHDVDLARYGAPWVAGACVLGGVGSPRLGRLRWGGLVLGGALLLPGVVQVARAHHRAESLEVQLGAAIQRLGLETSARIYAPESYLLRVSAGRVRLWAPPEGGISRLVARQGGQGRALFVTSELLTDAPLDGWSPLLKVCRHPRLRSRGVHERALYQYAGPARPPPPCEPLGLAPPLLGD